MDSWHTLKTAKETKLDFTPWSKKEKGDRKGKTHVIDPNFVVLGWTGNIVAQFRNGDIMNMNNYSITSLFKKIDNKWKVIHSHESVLPPDIIKK